MTVTFQLDGQPFMALNGGPMYTFSEAVSFMVDCESQQEIDHFWRELSEGADPKAQQCGWPKDRYGVSWQIVPAALGKLLQHKDAGKRNRVMAALLKMKKIDIKALERA